GMAKVRGMTDGLNDAQLIEELAGVAGTNPNAGTTGNGMIAALTWMGLEYSANRGADLEWIDNELAAGHDVIANGDYYSIPGREDPTKSSGHYIAVTAVKDDWTVYKVTDAADGNVTELTDDELYTFITSHPEGGFTLSAW